ncbi:hypothetical protein IT400_01555 [Candidatus Nomurabacteria bacterium]|nr:hypothetical protein [Candidatus Nomurabacteria bacterium]
MWSQIIFSPTLKNFRDPGSAIFSTEKIKPAPRTAKKPAEVQVFLTLCREQDLIITIFSDRSYMESLYNKLLFIKAMQKEELAT